ncbi:MAG: eukaryotic translation initiation factor eIF-2-beta/eIF-5 family protein [Nitrososphaerales archaeon]
MAQVNVPRKNTDAFCRYKRDAVRIQVLSKNGGTTVWDNFGTVCRQIYSDAPDVASYFQRHLGRPCRCEKAPGGIALVIRGGTIGLNALEDGLETFIEKYVLCRQCWNPETEVDGKNVVCRACGFARRP